MLLKGSCHCEVVTFTVESHYIYPFNYCYCSICRKTSGGGGYAINLSGDYNSLSISGAENLKIYHPKIKNTGTNQIETSPAEINFCSECGSSLWLYDSRWPNLVHPYASAIDSELPIAPERTHLMLDYKASWVSVDLESNDNEFPEFPVESIAEWHERLKLTV
ncbi:MAG: GFA family protein [Gammaproteobacteria bacterium]